MVALKNARIPWTDDEIQYLKDSIQSTSNVKIAEQLGRTIASVKKKVSELGIGKGAKLWTVQEIETVKEHAGKIHVSDIALMINRPVKSVKHRINELGLSYSISRRAWTDEQLDWLEELAGYKSLKDLAEILDHSENAISLKAQQLGLSLCTKHGIERNARKRQQEQEESQCRTLNIINRNTSGSTDTKCQNSIKNELLSVLTPNMKLVLLGTW